ncbi:head-tail connector protein [Alkalicoccus luteus]|uniref:DNA-packaging protein n=1 Tax=Alkalicoccus luteus TaxID=1237094 RepID=A0A969PSL7_9BACI|nr:head-tail connector protein [Alkalicoccus luteus]NJP37188.1 DNA-packaging protein [Alkalicoccus luteus]
MKDKVKLALRLSAAAYDDEVEDLIASCKEDLFQSGVARDKADDEDDPLIRRAIIVYAKANFGMDSPDAVRFHQSYESLKHHLSMAEDYGSPLE